jgi:hypothetical protein
MVQTFQQLGDAAADELQDTSDKTRSLIDRAINQGCQLFGAVLNREIKREKRAFSTEADSRYYMAPPNSLRIRNIVITVGGQDYPLEEITSPEEWDQLVADDNSPSDEPSFWHQEGVDQFGIWPMPASANPGIVRYESYIGRMSALDYSDGSITIANGSQAVVGNGTTFTAAMVGRSLIVGDSSSEDGIAYKIGAYVDATHLTLENVYNGPTATAKPYVIGEVPDIPGAFHDNLIDYALYRAYTKRRDRGIRADMLAAFQSGIDLCRSTYSSASGSQYTRARPRRSPGGYFYRNRNLRVQ